MKDLLSIVHDNYEATLRECGELGVAPPTDVVTYFQKLAEAKEKAKARKVRVKKG
jgi:hypothetical protein